MADEWDLPEYDQKVIDHLNAKGAADCPSCGHDRPEIVALAVVRRYGSTPLDKDSTLFLVPVKCLNCGNVRFFDAKDAGVRPVDPPEVEGNY